MWFCPCEFSPLGVLSTEGFVRLFFSLAFLPVGIYPVRVLSSGGFVQRGFCPLGVFSTEVLVHGVLSTGSLIN